MKRREPAGWGPERPGQGLAESKPAAATSDLPETVQQRARLDPPVPFGTSRPRSIASGFTTRRLAVTVLVSLGLHAAAVIVVLLLLHAGVPVADGPEKSAEVELVMEEHKGEPRPTAAPAQSAPPAAKQPPDKPRPSEARAPDETERTAPPAPDEVPPEQTAADTPIQPKANAPAKGAETPAPATPSESSPATQPAPTISLQGTDSPSDAKAFGANVIPAAADAVFHNRPPEYPPDSAMNGEHGTVVVVVHVSPMGTALGVDLVRSSGYVGLDSAAREAVMHWRFLPAVKDGQPVASDMAMGFDFENR